MFTYYFSLNIYNELYILFTRKKRNLSKFVSQFLFYRVLNTEKKWNVPNRHQLTVIKKYILIHTVLYTLTFGPSEQNRKNECSWNSFPSPPWASNFPPRVLTYLWLSSPSEKKYELYQCTKATEKYLYNTLNQIHIILNEY